jgi:hypothetical protein
MRRLATARSVNVHMLESCKALHELCSAQLPDRSG